MFRLRTGAVCLVGLAGLTLAAAACGQEGAVHVKVLLPENPQLSPVASQLARLTLVTESDGAPPQSATRDVPAMPAGAGAVSFGEVTIAPGVQLSLLGYTAAGRLVGYGRASVPIDVTAGDVRDVSIRLRRPFAYVAGGDRLQVFDTTAEAGQPFAARIDSATNTSAVATSSDGAEIVVVSGTSLSIFSTGNHARIGAQAITLPSAGGRVALSPDDHWAAVSHADPPGVSVIDLTAVRRGVAGMTFVETEKPGAIALSDSTAYVLLDPSLPGPPPAYVEDCSKLSRVLPVALSPARAGTIISLAGAARDLAVTPDGSALLVAEPCQDAVVKVTGNGASQVRVLAVANATDVAIAGGRVWTVGQDGPSNAVHLVVASAELDGRGLSRLDLPATQELAESRDLSETGQSAEVRLDADRLDAFALSVLPDGRSAAVLVHGSYHADEVVRPVDIFGIIYDETIVPRMDVDVYEYQLVDVTTGIATQRLRTSCNIDWERDKAVLDDWACASAPGQDSSTEDFVPRQAAVLYGGQ